jgi:hypothetical protein
MSVTMAVDRLRCVLVGLNIAQVRRLARFNNESFAGDAVAIAGMDDVALDASEQTILTNVVVCSETECRRTPVTWELWDTCLKPNETSTEQTLRYNLSTQHTKAIIVLAASNDELSALLSDIRASLGKHLPIIVADISSEHVLSSSSHPVVPFNAVTGQGASDVLQQAFETVTAHQNQSMCRIS